MIVVSVYIKDNDGKYQRIELFDDEKISVTSSIQDINDISKVYTDYSQSFTVPASKVNNKLFKHWYENSIQGGYDSKLKRDAIIVLDTIKFRAGVIQLDKASLRMGQPDNYAITFFGKLTSLKDKLTGKVLKGLDLSSIGYDKSDTGIINLVSGVNPTADVKVPLISSLRKWNATTDDITINSSTSAIKTSELFPAVRVSKLFEVMESQFGINFISNFFTTDKFKRLFLWLKSSETTISKFLGTSLTFQSQNNVSVPSINVNLSGASTNPNSIEVLDTSSNPSLSQAITAIAVTSNLTGIDCSLLIYKDGVLFNEIPFISDSTSTVNLIVLSWLNSSSATYKGVYSFSINTTGSVSINTTISTTQYYTFSSSVMTNTIITPVQAITATGLSTISNQLPDIKLEDLFSGVLKAFNLTTFSEDGVNYYVEPLEVFFSQGRIIDITQYVISDTMDIERVVPYKNIKFEYEKSASVLNEGYFGNTKYEYGTLLNDTGFDGGDYSLKLPFENLLFENIVNSSNVFTNIVVGRAVKSDDKGYVPKPVLLYEYGELVNTSTPFYINNGTTPTAINSYVMFGAETLISGDKYSTAFGEEFSVLDNSVITNSLFNEYYKESIASIYNEKARQYKFKAKLPISLLTSLRLNDRLVIRGKRFSIANYTTDLTTGEASFNLQYDARTLVQAVGLTAVNDTLSFNVNVVQDLFVMNNDLGGIAPVTITSINTTGFTLGTVSIASGGGKLVFTGGSTAGTQSFTYTITDAVGATSTATVTITLQEEGGTSTINAINDSFTVSSTGVHTLSVLSNDDLGNTPTTITSVNTTGFPLGTITINSGGGSLTFTPNGTVAVDTFTYTITDSSSATDTATVTIETTGGSSSECREWALDGQGTVDYTDCAGIPQTISVAGNIINVCTDGLAPQVIDGSVLISLIGYCGGSGSGGSGGFE